MNTIFYLSYDTKFDFLLAIFSHVKISHLENAMFLWMSKRNIMK